MYFYDRRASATAVRYSGTVQIRLTYHDGKYRCELTGGGHHALVHVDVLTDRSPTLPQSFDAAASDALTAAGEHPWGNLAHWDEDYSSWVISGSPSAKSE